MALGRFLGRKAGAWERRGATTAERFDWLYSDEELEEWLPRIEKLAVEAEEVRLMFNTKVGDQGGPGRQAPPEAAEPGQPTDRAPMRTSDTSARPWSACSGYRYNGLDTNRAGVSADA